MDQTCHRLRSARFVAWPDIAAIHPSDNGEWLVITTRAGESAKISTFFHGI